MKHVLYYCRDDELYEYLSYTVKELNVEDRFLLHGYGFDANEILEISDVFIFPSYGGGLSVALMQAMTTSLLVIASNIHGNIDCVDDGKGGIAFPPNDVESRNNAILNLKTDSILRSQYGYSNHEKVKLFCKTVVNDEYKKIFNQIIKG